MKIKIILILLIANYTLAQEKMDQKSIERAYNSFVSTLIPTIKTSHKSKMVTKGCNFDVNKVLALILFSKKMTHTFKFKPNCDLEGDYSPVVGKPFDIDFKVKNLEGFDQVKMKMLIAIKESKDFIVEFSGIDAELINPNGKAKFKFNYQIMADLFTQKVKPLGGEIQLISINDKLTNSKPNILK